MAMIKEKQNKQLQGGFVLKFGSLNKSKDKMSLKTPVNANDSLIQDDLRSVIHSDKVCNKKKNTTDALENLINNQPEADNR